MTSARALANQEREMQAKRLGRFARAGLLTVATLMTFVTAGLLIADRLYRPDAFVIDQLKLTGQFAYLTPEDIQAAVHQEPLGNFFSIELAQIKQRVEDMAWVKHADVRREWPHTLSIRVREHRPVMRWSTLGAAASTKVNKDNAEQWVSSAGEVITLDKPLDQHSSILLSGPEHDARRLLSKALVWQKRLSASQLKLVEVSLSPSQSWTLTLRRPEGQREQKFELLLGRDNADQRLARFQTLFDMHFRGQPREIVRVDARYPDGLAVEEKALEVQSTSAIPNKLSMPNDDEPVFAGNQPKSFAQLLVKYQSSQHQALTTYAT